MVEQDEAAVSMRSKGYRSKGLWVAEPNGSGGYQVVRRDRTGFVTEYISDNSFLTNARRAADRLNGYCQHDTGEDWRAYYSVKSYGEQEL
jgi:hypothetical protein